MLSLQVVDGKQRTFNDRVDVALKGDVSQKKRETNSKFLFCLTKSYFAGHLPCILTAPTLVIIWRSYSTGTWSRGSRVCSTDAP